MLIVFKIWKSKLVFCGELDIQVDGITNYLVLYSQLVDSGVIVIWEIRPLTD